MPNDFIPAREAELVTWSTNYKTLTTATPLAFSITVLDASTYAALHDSFVALYNTVHNGVTRSPANIIAKNIAKTSLIAGARLLTRKIQGAPAVTPEQKEELRINPRLNVRHPIAPPTTAPVMDLIWVRGHNFRFGLHMAGSTKRGKGPGIAGCSVYSFVGETPPARLQDWRSEGNITRTIVDIAFDVELEPGTKVWFSAAWYSPTGRAGPACDPVDQVIQFGGGMSLAA